MKKIEKPWGYEIHWAETDSYVGKLLFIKAGHRLSKQYHEIKEETLYVLSGILYNYDEHDTPMKILPGESFHVKPGQIHRFAANSCSVEVIEVSTPHLDDVIRLEDDYKRIPHVDNLSQQRGCEEELEEEVELYKTYGGD